MTSVDDSSFAAILAASVAASSRMMSRHCGFSENLRDGETAVDGFGRLGQRLLLGQAGDDLVRAGDVDVFERVVGRFDAGDINGLNLADVVQDGVELAGVAVQLVVGQCQPGQPGQMGHLVTGDLGHDRKA